MADDMDKVMEMSLDDYIATYKKEKLNSVGAGTTTKDRCNENKFKAERRQRSDDIDEDIDDSDANGIWKGPAEGTNFLELDCMQDDFETMFNDPDLKRQSSPTRKNKQNLKKSQNQMQLQRQNPDFDLRDKISRCPIPNSNSQQWRLMQPNVMNLRPAGMPPLVPQNSMQERQMQHRRRGKWGNNNCRKWGNNRNFNQQNCNGSGDGSGFFNINNANNFNNNVNSGRVQRCNQRNSQDILNKNIKAVIDRLNRSNGHIIPDIRDLTVEIPSASINLTGNPFSKNTSTSAGMFPTSNMNMQTLQPAAQNLLDGNKSNDGLRALLGLNDVNTFKTEMMPMLATKFLDFLQNGAQQTTHKPIYDMKLQKEIHEIQKKPLMYKCPGGEVISSDGAGINNCEIIPRSSGISLNNRFA